MTEVQVQRMKRGLPEHLAVDYGLGPPNCAFIDLTTSKRARYTPESSGEAIAQAPAKRLRSQIKRPGVPAPIPAQCLVVPDKPSPPIREDDKDGHYVYELGENLSPRYKILNKLGEGTFGRVLECWDRKLKEYVAIKVVRNIDKYRHAAMIELEVLNTMEQNDPQGTKHCVTLKDWFDYRGHVCMVFEKLGPSIYDFLRKNNYKPFPIDVVQSFSRQLLEAVAFMHDLTLIHTDLKPENILLVAQDNGRATSTSSSTSRARLPAPSEIKLIDFGSATFDEQYHSSIVSTRHYRAPEVILCSGWSYPCDMWSIGCIIVELLTGDALFQTHENLEHLAMMQQVLGPIPPHLVNSCGKAASKYFTRTSLNWPEGASSRKSVKSVNKLSNISALLQTSGHASSRPHVDMLASLIRGMLQYEPTERLGAQEALEHQFFQMNFTPAKTD